jgi:hypothetical protein
VKVEVGGVIALEVGFGEMRGEMRGEITEPH